MPADLSGGMRKRAGLARALALEPAILLADEPSAGLDPITAAEIDALLVDLRDRAGTTLLVVTHNIPSAQADRRRARSSCTRDGCSRRARRTSWPAATSRWSGSS